MLFQSGAAMFNIYFIALIFILFCYLSLQENIDRILSKVNDCERCSKLLNAENLSQGGDANNHLENNSLNDHNSCDENNKLSPNGLQKRVEELVSELVKTKVDLVDAECKNEELLQQLLTSQSELNLLRSSQDEAKNTWFSKTLTSIRESAAVTKAALAKRESSKETSMSRSSSQNF